MKEQITTPFPLFALIIIFIGCNSKTECFIPYSGTVDFKGKTHISIKEQFGKNENCVNTMSTIWVLDDTSFLGTGIFFLLEDRIIMQGIDPVSTDEFVFFDFQSNIDEVNNLII